MRKYKVTLEKPTWCPSLGRTVEPGEEIEADDETGKIPWLREVRKATKKKTDSSSGAGDAAASKTKEA